MGRPNRPYQRHPGRWVFRWHGEYVTHDAAGLPLTTQAQAWAELHRRTGGGTAPALTVAAAHRRFVLARGPTWQASLMSRFDEWCASRGLSALSRLPRTILADYAAALARTDSRRWGASGRMKPESVRHYVYAAHALLRYAHAEGWLGIVPDRPRLPKSPVRPKALTRDELAAAYRRLRAGRAKHLTRLVRFGVATGLRPGSLATLQWADVDLAARIVRLTEHKTAGKTGRILTLPLSARAVAILSRIPVVGPYVFVSRVRRPYTMSGLASTLRKAGVSPNRMRHTFAQRAMDAGAMQEDVGAALGHAGRSEMVRVYSRVSAERIRSAVELASAAGTHRPRETKPPRPATAARGKAAGRSRPPESDTDRKRRQRRA